MPKNIYLIRHAQTAYNAQRIVQGKGVDADLNAMGQAQGLAFYEAYKHIPFEAILTSTLKRTVQTVEPFLLANANMTHERLGALDEIDWGIFEGQPSTPALHAEYVGVLGRWGEGDFDARIQRGESAAEIAQRLSPFVEQLQQRSENQLLICTHGGILAFLMAMLQGQPITTMPRYRHRNTGVCHFVLDDGKFQLIKHDDVGHLPNELI